MGTGKLFFFIPLPPFLCQIRFGDWVKIRVGDDALGEPEQPPKWGESERGDGAAWGQRARWLEGSALAGGSVERGGSVRLLTSAATGSQVPVSPPQLIWLAAPNPHNQWCF